VSEFRPHAMWPNCIALHLQVAFLVLYTCKVYFICLLDKLLLLVSLFTYMKASFMYVFPMLGVAIVPLLKRSDQEDCLVFVKQFRVPLNAFIVEFPAGKNTCTYIIIQP
jgi:hypothetical protein